MCVSGRQLTRLLGPTCSTTEVCRAKKRTERANTGVFDAFGGIFEAAAL